MIRIDIPPRALVVPVGPAGSGKSTFLSKHFPATSIVSSDQCREMVSDDMRNQECNRQAFDLYHRWIEHRLSLGRLTVADATNLLPSARAQLRDLADRYGYQTIVLELDASLMRCLSQNARRDRFVPEYVIEKHARLAHQARVEIQTEKPHGHYLVNLDLEYNVVLRTGVVETTGTGYDIIGDIHGCADELHTLLFRLGYAIGAVSEHDGVSYVHPDGRKLVFVGDITDRGPNSLLALRTVQLALEGGHIAVMGNHDNKLMRALKGNKVQMGVGLQMTWHELQEHATPAERTTFLQMLGNLPYQAIIRVPGARDLVVCHAGLPKHLVGKDDKKARDHAIYGDLTGEQTPEGDPRRGMTYTNEWHMHHGPALVHGHTVVDHPYICPDRAVFDIDQGCVFGGQLTALRWPEGEYVQVKAKQVYFDKTYGSGALTAALQ